MTRAIRHITMLTLKDLRIEARGRQTIGLVVVLAVLIVVVLALGLGSGGGAGGLTATAILWVAYLFGGVLIFEKTMAVERHDDALAGLLLAPIDRGSIYIAKLLANLVLMFALALVVTPVGIMFFQFDLSVAPGGFALVMAVSMIGYAAVGTLFAALTSSTRLAGGLLAMLVFPITLPVVLISTRVLANLFEHGTSLAGSGLALLIAFDLMFLAASWLVFDVVLEA
ncbi:MAG: heme exporter protein CcmB [Phycisphaerales bacterium]|nr:heme exporter protein CcmB [Phycisphaerales bacterium]